MDSNLVITRLKDIKVASAILPVSPASHGIARMTQQPVKDVGVARINNTT